MTHTVHVRYYAQLRDALKTSGEEVTFVFPARESDILERLSALHPGQRALFMASRVAVEDGFVDDGALVREAAGLDIISPISGG
jgi:molybdopterin converting factor small subunit